MKTNYKFKNYKQQGKGFDSIYDCDFYYFDVTLNNVNFSGSYKLLPNGQVVIRDMQNNTSNKQTTGNIKYYTELYIESLNK